MRECTHTHARTHTASPLFHSALHFKRLTCCHLGWCTVPRAPPPRQTRSSTHAHGSHSKWHWQSGRTPSACPERTEKGCRRHICVKSVAYKASATTADVLTKHDLLMYTREDRWQLVMQQYQLTWSNLKRKARLQVYELVGLWTCCTSECKALWSEPEEVPSFAIVAHTHALHGIQTARELVDRIQTDQTQRTRAFNMHNDSVLCVCAHTHTQYTLDLSVTNSLFLRCSADPWLRSCQGDRSSRKDVNICSKLHTITLLYKLHIDLNKST